MKYFLNLFILYIENKRFIIKDKDWNISGSIDDNFILDKSICLEFIRFKVTLMSLTFML